MKQRLYALGLLAVGAMWTPVSAQVLAQYEDVRITADDVALELQMYPEDYQKKVLGSTDELRKLAGHMLIRQRLSAVAAQRGYLDEPLVKARLLRERELQLASLVPARQVASIEIPDQTAAAKAYYDAHLAEFTPPERVHLGHILLKAASDTEKQRRMPEAEQIVQELKGGASFADMAVKHSEDQARYMKGDLGVFGRGELVPEVESAAFALLVPGSMSDVVSSPYGLHILLLMDRPSTATQPFDEVKDPIIERLQGEYLQQQMGKWYDEVAPETSVRSDAVLKKAATAIKTKLVQDQSAKTE